MMTTFETILLLISCFCGGYAARDMQEWDKQENWEDEE